MKYGVTKHDRIIRIIIAIVIGILYLAGQIRGMPAIILGIVAVVFILTGIKGYFPQYAPVKISSGKKE